MSDALIAERPAGPRQADQDTGADGRAESPEEAPPDPRDRPLAGYAALMTTYASLTAVSAVVARRRGKGATPVVPSAGDIALLAVGTHRLSRMLARDRVTGVVRRPFAAFEREAPGNEVMDRPRGRGLRRAVGELLTCPFCLDQWVGTALGISHQLAPRLTRTTCSVLTAITAADALHVAHSKLHQLE